MRNLLTAHGAEHRRLRSLVSKAFTARRIEQLRPRIHDTITQLLDELPEHTHDGVVDLRAHYALPLPLAILAELFGLPAELRGVAHECMHTILSPTPESDPPAAYARLREVLVNLVAAKRAHPGDDLVSALIEARDGQHAPLTETEMVDTLGGVLGGGFESTANLIDQGITALCTHPAQLALVQAGQAAWEDVVEETLRRTPPLPYMPLRFAVNPIAVGDTVIERGDAIVACYGAIGTDPTVHGPDAERFDLTRPTRRDHMSFGHGPHVCIGALLARAETTTALQTLFDRYPTAALAVPTTDLEPISLIAHGHRSLPVALG